MTCEEFAREDYPEPVPTIDEFEFIENARTLPLESLVKMKLTSFRRKDQVRILDMISIGLVDETWQKNSQKNCKLDYKNFSMIPTVNT